MSYDNTNRGALFKNDNKETERHPDYKGNIDVNGVDYWIDAWIKKAESGRTYMSLSVKKKETKKEEKKSRPPKAKDQDPDIPF
ncbi:MAG TPA: hypothetical protein VFM33_02725 [Aquabacterium sp.]|nr:hypothetical protein [Aquabacterium sp.]